MLNWIGIWRMRRPGWHLGFFAMRGCSWSERCLGGWCLSKRLHRNDRTQSFPAKHLIVTRWSMLTSLVNCFNTVAEQWRYTCSIKYDYFIYIIYKWDQIIAGVLNWHGYFLYFLLVNKTHLTCWTETRPVAYNIALGKTHLKYLFYFLLLFPIDVTCTLLVCKFVCLFN